MINPIFAMPSPRAKSLLKSFVAQHQRRLKNGQLVTVKAHYDKRVKKQAIHAPDHNHDVSHLSEEDRAKFAQMHKERHLAHHYESHALQKRLEADKAQLALHEKTAQEKYQAGDPLAATYHRNKIIKLKNAIAKRERDLTKAKAITAGLSHLMEGMVKGSGEVGETSQAEHDKIAAKIGKRFSDTKPVIHNALTQNHKTPQSQLEAAPPADKSALEQTNLTPLQAYDAITDKLYDGEHVMLADYKQGYQTVLDNQAAIKAELNKQTKEQLLNGYARSYSTRSSDSKAELIESAYNNLLTTFLLGNSYSYSFGENRYKGITKVVDSITQADLDKFAQDQIQAKENDRQRKAEIEKGMENPQTLDDYTRILKTKMADGMTFRDAYMSIPHEQRVAYDELSAAHAREKRDYKKERDTQYIPTNRANTDAEIIKTQHTKKGHDIYVVKAAERVERSVYNDWNATAKKLGGYYSSYRGGGAIPGFIFENEDSAKAFQQYVSKNDTDAVKEQAKQARDAFADDKTQSTAERLNEMASRMEENAQEELGRDRKVNTHRRAGMANRAEAQARDDIAWAKTMRNIAGSLNNKTAQYLDRVRQKTQVLFIGGLRNETARRMFDTVAKNEHSDNRYKFINHPEMADYAQYPSYQFWASDLDKLGRQLVDNKGTKQLGNDLLKVANNMLDDYMADVKKDPNKFLSKLQFSSPVTSMKLAKEAIEKGGYKGKVVPYKVKNEIVLMHSPKEAQALGLWNGDKRITLSQSFGNQIVESVSRSKNVQLPYYFNVVHDNIKRLKGLGIETPSELRMMLREYQALDVPVEEQSKVKKLEREMVGRQNDGLDFFPTPPETAQTMVDAADLKEGMKVLEPSAGWGHIADQIREAGIEPDVIELSSKRAELLDAKGYNVVGDDFLQFNQGGYDRILMNPPFSDRRDSEHIQHAYDLLAPGGRLVAISGEGVFFGNDKRAQAFRDWFESVGGTDEKLEQGTFQDKNLPVNTGANARMIVIEKPVNANAMLKSFVAQHQRRLKNGQLVTVKAHYDKRVKKQAIHAPDHNHDVRHLSEEDRAKFAQMHKERHLAHHYESHALQKRLEADKAQLALYEKFAQEKDQVGDKLAATHHRNKIIKLKNAIAKRERDLTKAKAITAGISHLMENMVKGSGQIGETSQAEHDKIAAKIGQRFSDKKTVLKEKSKTEKSKRSFTYGDVYKTPEGKLVTMHGSGGLGSQRVKGKSLDSDSVNFFNRSELTPYMLIEDYKAQFEPKNPGIDALKKLAKEYGKNAAQTSLVSEKEDDLNPNSPNYRYRDTGYIAGSRKEAAAAMIRNAGKNGTRLRATDIDWGEIEQNPREAKQLITKSNLFGAVDWEQLKADGMEPGAGFLIDRIYASIAKEPEDGAAFRKDYALGLESLRDRLEKCKTPNEVTGVLNEIKDEWQGVMMSAKESEEYQAALAIAREKGEISRVAKTEEKKLYNEYYSLQLQHNSAKYEQERRINRKWKPDPELQKKIDDLKQKTDAAEKVWRDHFNSHPELHSKKRDLGNNWENHDNDLEWDYRQARNSADAILENVKRKNLLSNPATRAWIALGAKFHGVLNYRGYGGSKSFQNHVTTAKTGKITDWAWAEKDPRNVTTGKTATKKEVQFQLLVAENMERKGGKTIKIDSTAKLKEAFGLRDVQSGNWVLNDPSSAAFHVQKTAEAFSDLGDMLGVDVGKLAMNGRMALAFGARGKGNTGFGGAARAHYEPVQRVINLTKMGGGGCLGHEWFHALDNMASEMETGKPSGKDIYITEDPSLIPAGKLQDAVINLRQAVFSGDTPVQTLVSYSDKDYKNALYNFDDRPYGLAKRIKDAGSLDKAMEVVNAEFKGRTTTKSLKVKNGWVKITAAYFDGKSTGGTAQVKTGDTHSSFAHEAWRLDGGSSGKYWSKTRELMARAFQSYCEDKLEGAGRKNDYLSSMADNKYYKDGLFGPVYPFPDGEERKRINQAFDSFFGALRDTGTLQKALGSENPLNKSFVAAHQRRTKNGLVEVKAHYDKRVKKQAIHAPDHNHDVSHLSAEDQAKFAQMHKEQHLAHHYEAHALERRLEADKQLLATLERSAEEREKAGSHVAATATRNKIIKLKNDILKREKALIKTKAIVLGIAHLKNQLVAGSGDIGEHSPEEHAKYVEKLGARFNDKKQKTHDVPQESYDSDKLTKDIQTWIDEKKASGLQVNKITPFKVADYLSSYKDEYLSANKEFNKISWRNNFETIESKARDVLTKNGAITIGASSSHEAVHNQGNASPDSANAALGKAGQIKQPVKKIPSKVFSKIKKEIISDYKKQLSDLALNKEEKSKAEIVLDHFANIEMLNLPYTGMTDLENNKDYENLNIRSRLNDIDDYALSPNEKLVKKIGEKLKDSGIPERIYYDAAYDKNHLSASEKKENEKYLSQVAKNLEEQIKKLIPGAENFDIQFGVALKNAIPYRSEIESFDEPDVNITYTNKNGDRVNFSQNIYDGEFEDQFLKEDLADNDETFAKSLTSDVHAAATSPYNSLPEPTPAQIEAGNYKKGHITISGLSIAVENPKDSKRKGIDANGNPWQVKMCDHYGYFKSTNGNDDDPIDVFIHPNTPDDFNGKVFIVHQVHPDTGIYDEDKVMLGYKNKKHAIKGYQRNYSDGWQGLGDISSLTIPEFKAWLEAS